MLDGHATEAGFDPLELPLDRFCNWVYSWIAGRLDDKTRRMFDLQLGRPMPGAAASDEWSDDELAAEWAAML